MKGYDTLQDNQQAPSAPPPYSGHNQLPYGQTPVIPTMNIVPQQQQPGYYPQTSIHMMQPAHNTSVRVQGSRECCCCCCTCPFWVCCLMIGLLIGIPILVGVLSTLH